MVASDGIKCKLKMNCDFDIVIVGGGLVGASLACALSSTPFRIAIIEARPLGRSDQPSYDERTVALAFGSRRILDGMGLWESIAAEATPIESIHVSERGRFGVTRMRAQEENVAALGYVVANRVVGEQLYTRLSKQERLTIITPAQLRELKVSSDSVTLQIERKLGRNRAETITLRARLAVAADGSASVVRELVGIRVLREDYGQIAVVTNVTPQCHHGFVAYERFTDAGPLAVLPMSAGRCSVVWTHAESTAQATMVMDDDRFLKKLQAQFVYRLGRFLTAGKRHAYPLSLVQAQQVVKPRIALLGNAAHSLHPVAGQGFNLGLRDVAVLADLLGENVADPGCGSGLLRFANWRRGDLSRTIRLTDGLARLFTNPLLPLKQARSAGLVAMDLVPPLRRLLVRRTMGIAGRLPRLGAGLSLGDGR